MGEVEAVKNSKAKKKAPSRAGNVVAASAAAAHPSYLLMVKEAIGSLKERMGSSQYAIAKYLEEMYKSGLPPNFKKILKIQLHNMTKQGKVYKVKNSFKLSEELKKKEKKPMISKAPKSIVAIKDTKIKTLKTTTTTMAKKPAAAKPAAKVPRPSKAPKPETKLTKVPKAASAAAAKPHKVAPAKVIEGEEKKLTPAKKQVAKKAPKMTPKTKSPKSVKTVKTKTKAGKRSKSVAASSPAKKAKK